MIKALSQFVACITLILVCTAIAAKDLHYAADSIISKRVIVHSVDGSPQSLRAAIQSKAKPLNVLFIFGGGGMGLESTNVTGGLWCPDSFEDLHILRSLKAAYGDEIGILPIAIPAAHHMASFGFAKDVFLQPQINSQAYKQALSKFVESTQAAFDSGTIPVQPLYDANYNLLVSQQDVGQRDSSQSWHGAFRAEGESQTYGVPSIWIVNQDGRVLAKPFRGNDYHGHGKGISINYTLADVVDALDALR